MRRAQITGRDQPLEVVDAEVYTAPPEGVLVKTSYAGLCHTDLHFLMADDVMIKRVETLGDGYMGVTPGHETSGVIVGFGEKARPEDYGLAVGDRVCVYPWIGCQECENCLAGDTHLCENNRLGTTEMGQGLKPGGFASHVPVIHCKFVVKVPETISMDLACMMPCSAVTALNALNKTVTYIERALKARGSARLLVSGAGGVGLWAIQIAKTLYAGKNVAIMAADIGTDRLETATQFGASKTVLWNPSGAGSENIALTTEGGTAFLDAVVDFVNNPMTVEVILNSLRNGGTLVSCGFFGGTHPLTLPMVVAKTLSIQGSRVAPLSLLHDMVAMAAKSSFSYPSLEYYSLNDINTAVERMKARQIKGRALFKM